MSSYSQVSEGPVWMLARYLHIYIYTYIYVCMHTYPYMWASLVGQMVKNLLAMQGTQVWSLRQEYPLEKEMATHSSILVWRIPWTEEPGKLQSMGSQRVRHDWMTDTYIYVHIYMHIHFISILTQRYTRSVMRLQEWAVLHKMNHIMGLAASCPWSWWEVHTLLTFTWALCSTFIFLP